MDDYRCTLRKLAVRDDRYIEALLQTDRNSAALAGIEPQSHALVRMGALIAVDARGLPSGRVAIRLLVSDGFHTAMSRLLNVTVIVLTPRARLFELGLAHH